ncbi:hypothetical protein [Pleomorphovibrio marinus]|uniref:hypothetical protein n=1 Tax=Pleomorphovibrio marinus TaxID=2164132 RepID=UPI000E09E4CA|nr:hypothetical protein [Pleomorphovibrio marinus]
MLSEISVFKVKKIVLIALALVVALSCNKEDDDDFIKQENGDIWLSGGLANCAAQIRLGNGSILIVDIDDILPFVSGDRVSVKYKEVGLNEFCPPNIDCEITEIKKLE